MLSSISKRARKNKGKTNKVQRNNVIKRFGLTAYYDAMISNWFNNKLILFRKKNYIWKKVKKS